MVWFFVRQTAPDEFEVQILDDDGRARTWVRFPRGAANVMAGTEHIPAAVLRAAESQTEESGEYVGPDGMLLDFYGRPLAR